MEKSSTAFVGMDVHQESIDVAIADGKEARHFGRIGGDAYSVDRLLRRLRTAHRKAARVSWVIARRQTNLSKRICDIAWKAQLRLCSRFRRLSARRVPRNKVVVAIARELSGFVWAIAREVKPLA